MPTDSTPAAVITALDKVGVDFSVDRSELTDWLGNPEFTPYPAIAQAIFKLLNAGFSGSPYS